MTVMDKKPGTSQRGVMMTLPERPSKKIDVSEVTMSLSRCLGTDNADERYRMRGNGIRRFMLTGFRGYENADCSSIKLKVNKLVCQQENIKVNLTIQKLSLPEDAGDQQRPWNYGTETKNIEGDRQKTTVVVNVSTQTIVSEVNNPSFLDTCEGTKADAEVKPETDASSVNHNKETRSVATQCESPVAQAVTKSSVPFTSKDSLPAKEGQLSSPQVVEKNSGTQKQVSVATSATSRFPPRSLESGSGAPVYGLPKSASVSIGPGQSQNSRPLLEIENPPSLTLAPMPIQPIQQKAPEQTPPGYAYGEGRNQDEFAQAMNWKPKSEKESKRLEQLKTDLYQVLYIGKGCKLKRITHEFSKIVQEDLEDHLKKVGLPDVRTLLVQSRDLIFMKITNNGGIVYVYPNLSNKISETFTHIGDLVLEQRDNLQEWDKIPDPSRYDLRDYPLSALFQSTYNQPHVPQYPPGWPHQTYAHGLGYNSFGQHANYHPYYQLQQLLQQQSYLQNLYNQNWQWPRNYPPNQPRFPTINPRLFPR